MTEINPRAADHAEYRAGVRELCAQFDSAYWQRIEESSGGFNGWAQHPQQV